MIGTELTTRVFRFGAMIVAGGAALLSSAAAQNAGYSLERLGKVDFQVECKAEAQPKFNRAMALYHSFAWSDAASAFAAVAETDPACGMAHWGRAMVLLDNPFLWPANLPAQKLNDIAAALEAARSAGLRTERESGYVEAVTAFVRDHDKVEHRTRVQAFEKALGEIAAGYPDDVEAKILHALVTSANFDPADKKYSNQMRAAGILEPIFEAQPDHPGVAHYLIHTYDYPAIAQHGLDAAKRYAGIAPDAPHALHMPSHIFTRLGHWKESIASNHASADAAGHASLNAHYAYDYKVYAHLQLAQDEAARKVIDDARTTKEIDHLASAYAFAAMPARFALEREEWKQASGIALWPSADAYPWSKYPQAEAINAFARGVGAARIGNGAAAREEQKRLWALRDATKLAYWVQQIEIQADVVGSLALCADGKPQECVEGLRLAAAREDATEKHVISPGPILPARELLAETLLAESQAAAALAEFEAVLAKEPNRYRAVAGAMQAAQQAGEHAKVRKHAAHLAGQAADADAERASLAQARRLASQK